MFTIYLKTNTVFEKPQWCETGRTFNLLNLHQLFMDMEGVNSCELYILSSGLSEISQNSYSVN